MAFDLDSRIVKARAGRRNERRHIAALIPGAIVVFFCAREGDEAAVVAALALGYACDHTRDVVLLCAPEAGGGGRAVGRSCTGHPRRPAVTGTLPGLETLRATENLVLLDQLGRYRGWQRTRRIARARDELLYPDSSPPTAQRCARRRLASAG